MLSDTRGLTLQTLRDITRLAKAQNDEVFTPYRAKVEQQVQQLDAVLDLVAQRRDEVGVLVDWLAEFVHRTPLGVPGRLRPDLRLVRGRAGGAAAVSRRIVTNLVFFNVVFLVMLVWAVNNIVTIDAIERPYTITGDFAQAAGVRSQLRGHLPRRALRPGHRGRPPRRRGEDHDEDRPRQADLPEGSIARIFRKSAIGEPYIDFQPPASYTAAATRSHQVAARPSRSRARPCRSSSPTCSAPPAPWCRASTPNKAGSLVHELSLALDGRGQALRDLTTGFDSITSTLAARTDALDRLAVNNTRITSVLADHRLSIGQSIANLRAVGEALRDSKGDLQSLLEVGPQFLTTTADLVADQKQNLDCLLTDLAPTLRMASSAQKLRRPDHPAREGPHRVRVRLRLRGPRAGRALGPRRPRAARHRHDRRRCTRRGRPSRSCPRVAVQLHAQGRRGRPRPDPPRLRPRRQLGLDRRDPSGSAAAAGSRRPPPGWPTSLRPRPPPRTPAPRRWPCWRSCCSPAPSRTLLTQRPRRARRIDDRRPVRTPPSGRGARPARRAPARPGGRPSSWRSASPSCSASPRSAWPWSRPATTAPAARRRSLRRAASEVGTAFLTYDYQDPEAHKAAVLALATGSFRTEYQKAFDEGLGELITKVKATSKGFVKDVYVSEIDAERAQAIVVADVTRNGAGGAPDALRHLHAAHASCTSRARGRSIRSPT